MEMDQVGKPIMAPLLTYLTGLPLCFLPTPNTQARLKIHRHQHQHWVAYIPRWRGEARWRAWGLKKGSENI